MLDEELLDEMARVELEYDALYRGAGAHFDLPDCAMWVLYFLSCATTELTQQDLCARMLYPKQTVNSAVSKLMGRGLVELAPVFGTKRSKLVTLTEVGRETAGETVVRLRAAECAAVRRMGHERMALLAELYRDFREALGVEFEREGFTHGND